MGEKMHSEKVEVHQIVGEEEPLNQLNLEEGVRRLMLKKLRRIREKNETKF